ncbi:MAG: phosphatase PAP2 family protein [Pseudomonadota bacterium]|nr:phosphatase PAP2 family protein [Pseudomonadota bacterium]
MVITFSDANDAAEAIQEADAAVADAVEPIRKAPPIRLLSTLSEIGDQPQIRALSAALFAAGLLRRDRRLMRAGVRMLASHELATALKNFVKHRVDRTRPRSRDEALDAHKMQPGDDHAKEETSFPSGHSAGAASAARAFARELPDHAGAAYGLAAGVALAQIPRCAHYPTDVGAGLAIGIASELAVDAGWRAAEAAWDGLVAAPEPD